jgi:DNA-directed RNA polymerase subunit beta
MKKDIRSSSATAHLPERVLSRGIEGALAPQGLLEVQRQSWDRFWSEGFRELLNEISPIRDHSGRDLELSFTDYVLDTPPLDEFEAREHNASYEASVRLKARFLNKRTKEVKEQEVYLCEFPLMTPRGTFIVNGVERVIIPQLIRSPGVFFTRTYQRGQALFGAKVIPNRGAWLEFETDIVGVIGVKIDRRRRVPVTTLLRAIGVSDDEMREFVRDVDTGSVRYLEETLKRDSTKTADEALLEIYGRLRPGDLATPESARTLLHTLLFSFGRYDLARVGRWKMEMRLSEKAPSAEEITPAMRALTKHDILRIVREIIRMHNDPEARPDEIDHLGNRRVRTFGELLEQRLRVGFARMERIIKDRMSTLDVATVTPVQLVNARPVVAAIREFFSSSQLSQFMDNVNPLAELEHKRRVSAMGPGGLTRERAGFEVRDVQPSHYGRICPIQTPEGPNIGLVGHLALYARLNEFGFIETPYFRVKDGKVTDEIVWLDAATEQNHVIAHAGTELDGRRRIVADQVEVRFHDEPRLMPRERVEFMDVAPQQALSVATALIPFLEHDDATRAMMGANMQRQAVPCVRPEAPLVGTGIEAVAARESGQVVLAEEDGVVTAVDATHIVVHEAKRERVYQLRTFVRSNQYTTMSQRPIVSLGQRVRRGDVLADGAAVDDGELALGQNLLVAILPWRGANYEDAIVISERLLREDTFTSVHIEDFVCDVRDTKLGPEMTTPDIPNVGEEKLKDLDEDGIVRIGAEVVAGDILVGKISPKGETDLSAEERLLRAIFGEKARDVRDTSLRLPHGKRGRVISVRTFSRERGDALPPGVIRSIQVEVASVRHIAVGDKLAGRHGNKGVISKILPVEEMPFLEDGTPVDIVLNPLGVSSRMNLGQIFEAHLGLAALKLGFRAKTPALAGPSMDEIKALLRKAGVAPTGKVTLYDGYTGEPFPEPVTVGVMYIMKLVHMVEDKIHMRSIGPYSLITQQPLGGKAQFGGQRFGEMEVWALEGYGAAHTLQEMLTVKSDDVAGRSAMYEAIIRGTPLRTPNVPASFNVLLSELRSLGLSVNLIRRQSHEEGENLTASEDISSERAPTGNEHHSSEAQAS